MVRDVLLGEQALYNEALEILDSGSSGDLGYWTGHQLFEGTIGGRQMKMRIRITELFRLVAAPGSCSTATRTRRTRPSRQGNREPFGGSLVSPA